MIEWIAVEGSSWVAAEAYVVEEEAILVRFTDGGAWKYLACPPHIWAEFTAPGQSRGQYIHRVLKAKPGGKLIE